MFNKILSMNVVIYLLNVFIVVVVSGGPAWKEISRGSGLKIGVGGGRNTSSSRGNGIRLGGSTRGGRILTTVMPYEDTLSQPTATAISHDQNTLLHVGMVLPSKLFGVREYTKAVTSAKYNLQRKLKLFKNYDIKVHIVMKEMTPSPTAILKSLCKEFLSFNVSAILYVMNYEKYGRSTASAQYFLQLAGYLGIPVIAWNADNSGLERRASQSSLQLQLAPSLEHQTAAMLSILERYKWHQFSVVTSPIAGHDDFIQAVRERVSAMQDRFKFTILNAVLVSHHRDLAALVDSEARVMLLYCTSQEAIDILTAAKDFHLTGENYVWVVTQSVIANPLEAPGQFPIGMLVYI